MCTIRELEPKESTQGVGPGGVGSRPVGVDHPATDRRAKRRGATCCASAQRAADNAVSRVTVTADENISETAEAAIRILPPAATAPGTRAPDTRLRRRPGN